MKMNGLFGLLHHNLEKICDVTPVTNGQRQRKIGQNSCRPETAHKLCCITGQVQSHNQRPCPSIGELLNSTIFAIGHWVSALVVYIVYISVPGKQGNIVQQCTTLPLDF